MRAIRYGGYEMTSGRLHNLSFNPLCVQLDMVVVRTEDGWANSGGFNPLCVQLDMVKSVGLS